MARRIVDAGFPLTLWARRPASLEPFADTRAAVATTLPDLGRACDLLCVCVVNDDDVADVLRGPEGALTGMAPGGIVVIHSTVHPRTVLQLQADFPHLRVVDAPVSGGGQRAECRDLLVMVGGDEAIVDCCRPVFDTYAGAMVHLGPLGAGQQGKLLNNALFTAQIGLVADVYDIARRHCLDTAGLTTVLADGSGRSYAVEVLGSGGERIETMAQHAAPLLAKDVGILSELLGRDSSGVLAAADDALARLGFGRTASVVGREQV